MRLKFYFNMVLLNVLEMSPIVELNGRSSGIQETFWMMLRSFVTYVPGLNVAMNLVLGMHVAKTMQYLPDYFLPLSPIKLRCNGSQMTVWEQWHENSHPIVIGKNFKCSNHIFLSHGISIAQCCRLWTDLTCFVSVDTIASFMISNLLDPSRFHSMTLTARSSPRESQ